MTVEITALPTVILGFLAGLWLRPSSKGFCPGDPAGDPAARACCSPPWWELSAGARPHLAAGRLARHPAHPCAAVHRLGRLRLGPIIENAFMHGDSRIWLTHDMGIKFGPAQLPGGRYRHGLCGSSPPSSIAEDAVFSVPKHLTQGSLGAGGDPADPEPGGDPHREPGIFSAVMMGLAAPWETMIVLMATGNTPIMDFSMFQGCGPWRPTSRWRCRNRVGSPTTGCSSSPPLCCLCSPSSSTPGRVCPSAVA